ncbi:SOS response-associated peptidase family protein [Paenibacillus solisilvae]|uniref:Abasic site processing protein n=1 Tax=Paenibacillus solisilvae TaxID=2486751 RepID=A0ABW0VY70_9BACL
MKIGYKTINARAEGIEKKPAFRHLLNRNRLLFVSDGFYEWRKEEGRKQPFRFQLKSGWRGADNRIILTVYLYICMVYRKKNP